jgi:predicted site-specific integrase-resolvase
MAKQKLISSKECLRLLEIDSTTLTRLVRAGKIRKVIPPGMTYGKYRLDDVLKFKEERERFRQQFEDSQ